MDNWFAFWGVVVFLLLVWWVIRDWKRNGSP